MLTLKIVNEYLENDERVDAQKGELIDDGSKTVK